jgi:CheY-like chemotaxis protein
MSKTVVVIEDDEAILALLEMVLLDEGYLVKSRKDWNKGEGIEFIKALQPALVITDLKMGEGSSTGLDLAVLLKEEATTAQIPVLLCTAAYSQAQLLAMDFQVEGCRVLLKPFDLDQLIAVVGSLIDSVSPSDSSK